MVTSCEANVRLTLVVGSLHDDFGSCAKEMMTSRTTKDDKRAYRLPTCDFPRCVRPIWLGLLITLVSGCHTVPLSGQLEGLVAPDQTLKLPVTIGLRFSTGFRTFAVDENHSAFRGGDARMPNERLDETS